MTNEVGGEAKLEGVDEAPCYYPTVAQFAEPLEYIASIRPEAERYGICRICPPPGWKPPFAHRPDKLKFATKEQDLGKLAGAQRLRRKFTENLRKFLFLIGKPMESAHGGKVFVNNNGGVPVDTFSLFKKVQRMGGHEAVTRDKGWTSLATRMGFLTKKAVELQHAYLRYLADFEAVHSGRSVDWEGGVAYTPTAYREKPSVEADIRVGMSLWHFLEEEHGAGRCYHGTVKALRASNCIVEYNLAERFPESHGRSPYPSHWDNASFSPSSSSSSAADASSAARVGAGAGAGAGEGDAGDWSGAGNRLDGGWGTVGVRASSCEEVEPFRVTLPRSQLSTLVLNGRSPAAAKLAAHGVVCEVCSIAAASNKVLAVCVACDSAYHLGCVEPALDRVPFNDWFCGDCAKDGSSAEDLARGSSGLFSSTSGRQSVPSPMPKKPSKHVPTGSIPKLPTAAATATSAGKTGGDSTPPPAAAAAADSAPSGMTTPTKAAGGGDVIPAFAAAVAASESLSNTLPKKPALAAALRPSAQDTTKTEAAGSPLSSGDKGGADGSAAKGVWERAVFNTTDEGGAADSTEVGAAKKVEADAGNAAAAATAGEAKDDAATAAAAAATAAALVTPKRATEGESGGEDASASESEAGGGGGASLSAARMRGVSRMKGRALKYGFGNGGVYSLKEFALMADGWRSGYLARRGLGDEASEAEMEAEFWKLVGPDPPEDDVKVLYGSDLDTGAVGSGFPWTRGAVAAPAKPVAAQLQRPKPDRAPPSRGRERDYAPHPASYEHHSYEEDAWNLNCLPTSDGSLLQFLGTQIQGVMVPWLYVGMAFSAFCWHNEDHYLYSINYLHAGSPKRWYGVPGSLAEKFESTVKVMFPELFEAHPDLLMQLVTMAHPSEVAKRGVTVSSTTQREGEFVLTFPQAYHAGFNMGTNCAEAVNFAPPDWIPWGNAAQERYRLHKRKPVFSHEGLVLSLVDILSKNASNGVHASDELTRFLRNELEVLATAQEQEKKKAELVGCARFEPMEKLVELLRGGCSASASAETATVSSIVRRSSTCSERRRGKENGCADGEGGGGGGGILEGLESGSAVQGPRCSVCDQYCFLTAVVCHTCDAGAAGRAPVRASSNGSPGNGGGGGGGGEGGAAAAARRRHARRRFACGRHLADLCQCPASEYTYYQRRDAAQLRATAEGLTSSEEQAQAWMEKAKSALAAAKATGGGMVSSFRPSIAKCSGDGDADGSGATAAGNGAAASGKAKLEANPQDETDADASASASASQQQSSSASGPAADNNAEEKDGVEGEVEVMGLQLDVPAEEDEEAPPLSSLLPAGWRERPPLRYIADLIRVGKELAAPPEQALESLRDVVDACAGWVKTIEGILGADDSDGTAAAITAAAAAVSLFGTAKRAAATTHVGDDNGGGSGGAGGARGRVGRGVGVRDWGAGRSGARSESSTGKRREQVPFHKATKLLSTEAKLPGRPVETTERLCVAILAACHLRLQVRSLLGLGEDEHIMAARSMCLTLQEAGRTASPLELASSTAKSPDNGAAGGAGSSLGESKPSLDSDGGSRSSSSPSDGAAGGSPSFASPTPGAHAEVKTSGNDVTAVSPRLVSSRTRTRTNVHVPTGTLAAERGMWKMQPWRLWPVHQLAAAALVEPCLNSVVAVPEVALLRKALVALAERTDKAVRMADSGAGETGGGKRRRDSSGAGAGGGDGGGGEGTGGGGGPSSSGGARGKSRGSGGGGCGGKAKPAGSLAAYPGSSKGRVGAGGGVLLGGAHKRRRQDDRP